MGWVERLCEYAGGGKLVKQPETRAIVRYKGRVRGNPGTLFGVEILVSVLPHDIIVAERAKRGEATLTDYVAGARDICIIRASSPWANCSMRMRKWR